MIARLEISSFKKFGSLFKIQYLIYAEWWYWPILLKYKYENLIWKILYPHDTHLLLSCTIYYTVFIYKFCVSSFMHAYTTDLNAFFSTIIFVRLLNIYNLLTQLFHYNSVTAILLVFYSTNRLIFYFSFYWKLFLSDAPFSWHYWNYFSDMQSTANLLNYKLGAQRLNIIIEPKSGLFSLQIFKNYWQIVDAVVLLRIDLMNRLFFIEL